MKPLFGNWDLMRILRLVVGGVAIYQAFAYSQVFLGILGGFFVLQAALNVGCAACNVSQQRRNISQRIENTEYEEVK